MLQDKYDVLRDAFDSYIAHYTSSYERDYLRAQIAYDAAYALASTDEISKLEN